jgi:5-methylcytosine-specific restriction endonuclease McrA
MPKPCNYCSSLNHSSSFCWQAPKKQIKVNRPMPRPTKRIPKTGKVSDQWVKTKHAWIKDNLKPGERVACHYCGKQLTIFSVTLDHKIPRSRAPELRYEAGNLVPACYECNTLKGSVAHDEYKHVCHS